MSKDVMLITGDSKGIGRYLVEYYISKGFHVIGCSRGNSLSTDSYQHFCADVSDEDSVKKMFKIIRQQHGHVDVLINNAGVASMNHSLLTTIATVRNILNTNVVGTFLFCREAAKLMRGVSNGRIVNFSTAAVPLKLDGEAVYAASKAAVVSLTQILAKELSSMGITVNAVGPTPIKTDLIKSVSSSKIEKLLNMQTIHRYGEFVDVVNVIDFFLRPESNFITGQVIYLGGV